MKPVRYALPAILALAASAPAQVPADGPPAPPAFAQPFRTGAVLQRECDLPVWGTAAPGSAVAVFLDSAIAQTTADEAGRWRVVFPPQAPGAGHHLALVVNGRPAAVVEDIAIGDVWFCAGNDEMAMSFYSGIENGEAELADTDYPGLRVFGIPCELAIGPQTAVRGGWTASDVNAARASSALAYLFGRRLHKELDVPVGLVVAARGPSPAVAWLPLDAADALAPDAAEARRKALRAWTAGGEDSFERGVAEWEASFDGSDPYENADILPSDADFEEDSAWISTEVPTTMEKALDSPDFNGVAWFRRSVFLTAEQAAKKATLRLGHIDDDDSTWINGGLIGESRGSHVDRAYAVPDGALRAGPNLIAVRVFDAHGIGGFTDKAGKPALRFDDGTSVDLSQGLWSLRVKKAPRGPRPRKTLIADDAIGICFDSLVRPFAGMAVRGILWAGGDPDVRRPEGYGAAMEALVRSWRGAFAPAGQGDIPFLVLQAASHGESRPEPSDSAWAAIRKAQMDLADALPGVYVAVSLDDGNPWVNMSPRKRTAADRLSDIALAEVFGRRGVVAGSPRAISAAAKGGKVAVAFRNALPLAASDGGPVRGFQLAAADGAFVRVAAALAEGGVALDIPEGMAGPATVRYAWDDYADANLVGSNGHPVGTFELAIAP